MISQGDTLISNYNTIVIHIQTQTVGDLQGQYGDTSNFFLRDVYMVYTMLHALSMLRPESSVASCVYHMLQNVSWYVSYLY